MLVFQGEGGDQTGGEPEFDSGKLCTLRHPSEHKHSRLLVKPSHMPQQGLVLARSLPLQQIYSIGEYGVGHSGCPQPLQSSVEAAAGELHSGKQAIVELVKPVHVHRFSVRFCFRGFGGCLCGLTHPSPRSRGGALPPLRGGLFMG